MCDVTYSYHEIYNEIVNIDIEQLVKNCLTNSVLGYLEVTLIITKYIVNLKC